MHGATLKPMDEEPETHEVVRFRRDGTAYRVREPGPPSRPTHEWDPVTQTMIALRPDRDPEGRPLH